MDFMVGLFQVICGLAIVGGVAAGSFLVNVSLVTAARGPAWRPDWWCAACFLAQFF